MANPEGGRSHFAYQVRRFIMSQPGKRGIDVPEARYDHLLQIASGITQPVWGMYPTPAQMQYLHDHNLDTSQKQMQGLFGRLPHPKAPSMPVGEYQQWSKAHQVVKQHGS